GIRDRNVTGVQTCALPILPWFRRVGFGLATSLRTIVAEANGGQSFSTCRMSLRAAAVPVSAISARCARNAGLRSGSATSRTRERSEERRVGKEGGGGGGRE